MGKKRKTILYFAEKEEQAVIDYITTDSAEEKNRIYKEILLEPFKKMTQSILRRYPIHIGNYDIEEIEANALSHLIEHMVEFKPNTITKSGKKTKAYSYCQTIVRNYYRDHSKKSYNEKMSNLPFDDYFDELKNNEKVSYEFEYEGLNKMEILINKVVDGIENKINDDISLKKNEIVVGEAIVNVLKNWHLLFQEDSPEGKYNKKVTNKYAKYKILLFLKEQTNLSTKEIRLSMKPFKEIYYLEKLDFIENF